MRWERPEAESREEKAEGTVKLKIIGIWVVVFVVNLLDRICSLSCWFLVCLEDNNVIFEQWFCLEPMFNRISQNFCFLVKRMCRIFNLKLFFCVPLLSLPLGGLRQLPNSPKGRAGPGEKPPITTYTINTIHADTREQCRPWFGSHVHMHWTVKIVTHGQKLTHVIILTVLVHKSNGLNLCSPLKPLRVV